MSAIGTPPSTSRTSSFDPPSYNTATHLRMEGLMSPKGTDPFLADLPDLLFTSQPTQPITLTYFQQYFGLPITSAIQQVGGQQETQPQQQQQPLPQQQQQVRPQSQPQQRPSVTQQLPALPPPQSQPVTSQALIPINTDPYGLVEAPVTKKKIKKASPAQQNLDIDEDVPVKTKAWKKNKEKQAQPLAITHVSEHVDVLDDPTSILNMVPATNKKKPKDDMDKKQKSSELATEAVTVVKKKGKKVAAEEEEEEEEVEEEAPKPVKKVVKKEKKPVKAQQEDDQLEDKNNLVPPMKKKLSNIPNVVKQPLSSPSSTTQPQSLSSFLAQSDDENSDPDETVRKRPKTIHDIKDGSIWRWEFSRTKSRLGFNKNCVFWQIAHGNEVHQIELFHSTLSGKRTIKIDGKVKLAEKKLRDSGSRYDYKVSTASGEPLIVTIEIHLVFIDFQYELLINGHRFDDSKHDWLEAQHMTQLKEKAEAIEREHQMLLKQGKKPGIKPPPPPTAPPKARSPEPKKLVKSPTNTKSPPSRVVDDDEEEEIPKPVKRITSQPKVVKASPRQVEDEEEEEEEEETTPRPVVKRVASQPAKSIVKAAPTKATPAKQVTSKQAVDDDEEEEEEEEEETPKPVVKRAATMQPKAVAKPAAKPKPKPAPVEDDEEEEVEEEEIPKPKRTVPPKAKSPVKKVVKKPVQQEEDDDE